MGASIWNEDARKLSQVKWLRERDQRWKSKNKNEEHEQRNLTLTCMLINLQTQSTKKIKSKIDIFMGKFYLHLQIII